METDVHIKIYEWTCSTGEEPVDVVFSSPSSSSIFGVHVDILILWFRTLLLNSLPLSSFRFS